MAISNLFIILKLHGDDYCTLLSLFLDELHSLENAFADGTFFFYRLNTCTSVFPTPSDWRRAQTYIKCENDVRVVGFVSMKPLAS